MHLVRLCGLAGIPLWREGPLAMDAELPAPLFPEPELEIP